MGSVVHLYPRPALRSVDPALQPEDEREYFWVPLLVLWLGSIARVGLALVHDAAFESEATLALVCVIVLPLAAFQDRLHQRPRPPKPLHARQTRRLSPVR